MNMKSTYLFLALMLTASSLLGDEADLIKAIIAAKDKPLGDFVAEVVKAPPRQFRDSNIVRTKFTAQWEQVGDILADKLQVVGGTRFVVGKSFGIEELKALVILREWLLSAPSTYFNVCYSVVVEATVARSSMALIGEKATSALEVKKVLDSMSGKPVKASVLFDLALKANPKSARAKELAGLSQAGNLADLSWAAEELAADLHESVPATAKELIEGVRPAGLLFASWTATSWTASAMLTCSYVENGGTLPTDAVTLKADLKKRLPDAFSEPNSISGVKLYPLELADAILSALANRK
ncbi:MAG: hypothetical protein Q8M07_14380 [Prosthecobacter sp.]|nr:hypothetical protein [Prosthecobacter sp.]